MYNNWSPVNGQHGGVILMWPLLSPSLSFACPGYSYYSDNQRVSENRGYPYAAAASPTDSYYVHAPVVSESQ